MGSLVAGVVILYGLGADYSSCTPLTGGLTIAEIEGSKMHIRIAMECSGSMMVPATVKVWTGWTEWGIYHSLCMPPTGSLTMAEIGGSGMWEKQYKGVGTYWDDEGSAVRTAGCGYHWELNRCPDEPCARAASIEYGWCCGVAWIKQSIDWNVSPGNWVLHDIEIFILTWIKKGRLDGIANAVAWRLLRQYPCLNFRAAVYWYKYKLQKKKKLDEEKNKIRQKKTSSYQILNMSLTSQLQVHVTEENKLISNTEHESYKYMLQKKILNQDEQKKQKITVGCTARFFHFK
ncbi:hypothetical protein BT96DRAFT_951229 [Gymnopus androsaceus JB14]|uniref:Uncharacterized protein n=1 Tax=Gymnopus androsaceus JB14 TaxID=1447944 RepID=A0A6A4GDS5_9AGAR|nr:hypothetical protein BT96DRAFT_951229 [Gymnopus androsaceus JB14]